MTNFYKLHNEKSATGRTLGEEFGNMTLTCKPPVSVDVDEGETLPPVITEVPKELLRTFPHTKRVGHYLLGKTLGEGSFAKVREGLHILTGEKVAIKVIDKKKAKEDAYVRKNLRREGKLLQMVRHKNVVQLYEIMETENSFYLVTEICKGGDMMDHICGKKKLDEKETRKFIRQIISAVDFLHKVGILHRDLKVENLLLDENRDIKIIDFGLSNAVRVAHNKDGSTMREYCVTQCGSPAYAAPELLGNKKYGPKVDVWSIGVNMYAMLTGNLPFTVDPFNIKALHNKMLKGDMNALPDHISKYCKDMLNRFLTPDPDKRISLQETMNHPWITDGKCRSMEAAPYPNKLCFDDLNESILKHMSQNMDFKISEVIRMVTNNIANSATATYHLLLQKLNKYQQEKQLSNKKTLVESRVLQNNTKNENSHRDQDTEAIDLFPLDTEKTKNEPTASSRKESNTKAKEKGVSSKKIPSTPDKKLPRRLPRNSGLLDQHCDKKHSSDLSGSASVKENPSGDNTGVTFSLDVQEEVTHGREGSELALPSSGKSTTGQLPSIKQKGCSCGETDCTDGKTDTHKRNKHTKINTDSQTSASQTQVSAKIQTHPYSIQKTRNTLKQNSTQTNSSSLDRRSVSSNHTTMNYSPQRKTSTFSDPVTKGQHKTARILTQHPTSKVLLDIAHYDRFARQENTGTESPTLSHNKKYVNMLYQPYTARSKTMPPKTTPLFRNLEKPKSTSNSYNITADELEIARMGQTRLTGLTRGSLDNHFPQRPAQKGSKPLKSLRFQTTQLTQENGLESEKTFVLPDISPSTHSPRKQSQEKHT